ncbi:MAG TPA: Flp pilus assembly protein CpaB [Candidatus Sulfotelmatobacter sp.]|nr:Flp pilus assembly protein CpaB [Candidatus Sulfotelmatobacter sp.]
MNRTRLMMIGALALAAGFLASVYVYKNLQAKSGTPRDTAEVMVAANDLQVGAKVEERDIKVIKIPSDDLPFGAPRKKADVVGRGVIIPISKGDFILPNSLAGENAGAGLPALIPPGMRAVSVRVNEVVSVAGFVTPGTRVDVLLTGTPGASGEQQTTTVLQNVAVLASGNRLERTSTGEAQNTAVITLLVTPDDAQRLTLASSEGHIQLALRNPLDTKQDEVPVSMSHALYRGTAAPQPEHAPVRRVRTAKVTPPPIVPAGVSVEVYQGDKKPDVIKCGDEGCENK